MDSLTFNQGFLVTRKSIINQKLNFNFHLILNVTTFKQVLGV